MSKLNKNDRLKRKAFRDQLLNSPFYDDIFEAFKTRENDRIERKKKLYLKVPSNYPKFTPSEVLVPRHIWRHDRIKIRCDFFKKTPGAKRNRVLQDEISSLKRLEINELSRTQG